MIGNLRMSGKGVKVRILNGPMKGVIYGCAEKEHLTGDSRKEARIGLPRKGVNREPTIQWRLAGGQHAAGAIK
jgi:hypothetical protein